ncbi:MAG: hypothetical protein ACQBVK_05100 [Candidatus Phytoplasma sp. TWB_XP]
MNDLLFAIGFIVGALFTTALMFIIKKIFFNFPQFSENNKINQKNTNESKKDINKQEYSQNIAIKSLTNPENNLENDNKINAK